MRKHHGASQSGCAPVELPERIEVGRDFVQRLIALEAEVAALRQAVERIEKKEARHVEG